MEWRAWIVRCIAVVLLQLTTCKTCRCQWRSSCRRPLTCSVPLLRIGQVSLLNNRCSYFLHSHNRQVGPLAKEVSVYTVSQKKILHIICDVIIFWIPPSKTIRFFDIWYTVSSRNLRPKSYKFGHLAFGHLVSLLMPDNFRFTFYCFIVLPFDYVMHLRS